MAAKNTPVAVFNTLSEAFDKANADGKLNNAGGRLTKAVKKAIEAVGLDPKTSSVEKLLYEFLALKGVTVQQAKTKNVSKQSVMDLLRDALHAAPDAEDYESADEEPQNSGVASKGSPKPTASQNTSSTTMTTSEKRAQTKALNAALAMRGIPLKGKDGEPAEGTLIKKGLRKTADVPEADLIKALAMVDLVKDTASSKCKA